MNIFYVFTTQKLTLSGILICAISYALFSMHHFNYSIHGLPGFDNWMNITNEYVRMDKFLVGIHHFFFLLMRGYSNKKQFFGNMLITGMLLCMGKGSREREAPERR